MPQTLGLVWHKWQSLNWNLADCHFDKWVWRKNNETFSKSCQKSEIIETAGSYSQNRKCLHFWQKWKYLVTAVFLFGIDLIKICSHTFFTVVASLFGLYKLFMVLTGTNLLLAQKICIFLFALMFYLCTLLLSTVIQRIHLFSSILITSLSSLYCLGSKMSIRWLRLGRCQCMMHVLI